MKNIERTLRKRKGGFNRENQKTPLFLSGEREKKKPGSRQDLIPALSIGPSRSCTGY